MTTDNSIDPQEEIARIEEMISGAAGHRRTNIHAPVKRPVRPKNASTIILVDGKPGRERIVMGKRNKALKFMPGALVFPGGRVDRADKTIPTADEINPTLARRLAEHMRGPTDEMDARSLATAAVRELAEETGILMGREQHQLPKHRDWHQFSGKGIAPAIGSLRLLSRAITPPASPRRFDTFFFVSRMDDVHHIPAGGFEPSGELEDLQWIRPEDAIRSDTREITRVMLVELMLRLKHDPLLDPEYPAPSYASRLNRFYRREI